MKQNISLLMTILIKSEPQLTLACLKKYERFRNSSEKILQTTKNNLNGIKDDLKIQKGVIFNYNYSYISSTK